MEGSTAMKQDVSPYYLVFLLSRAILAIVVLAAMLSLSVGVTHASGGHAPIVIQSDNDFASLALVPSRTCTTSNPLLIGPLPLNNVNGQPVPIDRPHLP